MITTTPRGITVLHQSARALRQAAITFIGLCKIACRTSNNPWLE